MNWGKLTFSFVIVVFVLIFFILLPAKEWTAVLLILFSFILLFTSRHIRRDGRLLLFSILILAVRQGISIVNVYFTTIFGAGLDATAFHLKATDFARSAHATWFTEFGSAEIGSTLYVKSLGFCYRYLGESLLMGQSLSILAYVIAGILLIKMIIDLGLSKWKKGLILLYGGLPPAIIYESITMRESWQALFFLFVCYCALQLRKQVSIWKIVSLMGVGISFGFLHNGLLVYTLFLICYSIFWGLRFKLANWKTRNLVSQLVSIPLLIGIFLAWWNLAGDVGGASQALVKGETANYYETYREKGEQDARANYDVKLDTSTVPSAFGTGFLAFIFYLFAPFPWQIGNLLDLYAFAEAVFRFLLIYYGIKVWWYSSGERKSTYSYLLICGISLELLWSFGTANWGTAIRHHLVAYGLLVLVGGPGVLNGLIGIFNRLTQRKRGHKRRMIPVGPFPARNADQSQVPLAVPSTFGNAPGK